MKYITIKQIEKMTKKQKIKIAKMIWKDKT